MDWQERMLVDAGESTAPGDHARPSQPDRISALMTQQMEHWPLLLEGYGGLAQVLSKPIQLRQYEIFVQYNPRRIQSTTAKVDSASINRRPCFLCPENLPPEEKGIPFGQDWIILCNPFPVLDRHLSIVHRRHIPQTITGHFEALLELTRALGRRYFALYNGPESGASAPDHLHFQACASQGLPVEAHFQSPEAQSEKRSNKLRGLERSPLAVLTLRDYPLQLLVGESPDLDALAEWFYSTLARLRELMWSDREPLINLVAVYDSPNWRVYFFPRARHRPACYYAEGEDRLTVSPAAIDLAGFLIVPVREHFQRIGASEVQRIFSEVTLSPSVFAELLADLTMPAP